MMQFVLAAMMTIAHCDLDHDLSKFDRSDADYVGLIDVDWHAKRSGEVAQAEALAEKYGYVSSYTTDHFIYETPDEQHGVAILSHEAPKSRQIVKLPSTGKGKVFLGGRGPGTNDTVKRYSRGGCVMVDPSVRRLRVRLTW